MHTCNGFRNLIHIHLEIMTPAIYDVHDRPDRKTLSGGNIAPAWGLLSVVAALRCAWSIDTNLRASESLRLNGMDHTSQGLIRVHDCA